MKPRVLICGSRDYTDYEKIKFFVYSLPPGSSIIEGECKGADKLARMAAEEKGIPKQRIFRFPVDWSAGKRGGPVRNKKMLDEGKPTVVIAFHDDAENSKGTKNMIEQSLKAGIPVYLNPESWWDLD